MVVVIVGMGCSESTYRYFSIDMTQILNDERGLTKDS